MKILVLGAGGMLGHKLYRTLLQSDEFDVYGTLRAAPKQSEGWDRLQNEKILHPVDAMEMSSVRDAIGRIEPDAVINCIGVVIKLVEDQNPSPTIQVNALFPHQLHEICRQYDSKLIHISTDCVFSGKKGMYTEADLADAHDLYGRSKLLGEVSYDNALTIRTSLIGSELGRSHGLLEWFFNQRGKTIEGYARAIFSGFTTIRMAHVLMWILKEHPSLTGLYHVSSSPISKLDLLTKIRDALGLNIVIKPNHYFVIDRSLDCGEFIKETHFDPLSWDEMIAEFTYDEQNQRQRSL